MYPSDRKYTADHLWVRLDGSRATVGVTQYMMEALYELLIVLPTVGQSMESRQTCGEILGATDWVELVSPLTGKVTGINTALVDDPQPLCADPHGTWLIQFELTDTKQIGQLLMNADYERLLKAPPAPAPPVTKSPPKPAPKASPPPKAEVKPAPKAPAVPPAKPPAPARPGADTGAAAAAWITRLRGTSLTDSDASFDRHVFLARVCHHARQRSAIRVEGDHVVTRQHGRAVLFIAAVAQDVYGKLERNRQRSLCVAGARGLCARAP
jgi:glycine cleavage system H protein